MSLNYLSGFIHLPFVSLVPNPTPVHPLERLGAHYGHSGLFIKREDQTHSIYGGNKVRNLEFVLARALARNKRRVVTIVPKGSNFTAALSAHARALGLDVHLAQFAALENEQIEAHFQFSLAHGARAQTFTGPSGPLLASLDAAYRSLALQAGDTEYIPPGASSVFGALGHANAFLEFAAQLQRQEIPVPDMLVVGAGTCGTTAGLLAGIHLSRLPIRLIAVRCAEPIVCNRFRVRRLAQAVLKRMGENPGRLPEFDLVESPENLGYAKPTEAAREVMEEFASIERIRLDTTYTSKVALFLKRAIAAGEFRDRRVLYWHTFSPAALSGALLGVSSVSLQERVS